eukprot:1159447-Pelagomonas_calceolata.AAC.5
MALALCAHIWRLLMHATCSVLTPGTHPCGWARLACSCVSLSSSCCDACAASPHFTLLASFHMHIPLPAFCLLIKKFLDALHVACSALLDSHCIWRLPTLLAKAVFGWLINIGFALRVACLPLLNLRCAWLAHLPWIYFAPSLSASPAQASSSRSLPAPQM